MNEIPRFEFISALGHGQFSDVFKARLITPPVPGATLNLFPDGGETANQDDGKQQTLCAGGGTAGSTATTGNGHHHSSKQQQQQQEIFVAVKRIKFDQIQHSSERSGCYEEVRLLQRLSHRNIIRYHISFIEGPVLYIVLEYAGGGDLSKLIRYFQRRNEYLNERTILKYFTQVCSAVQYIHSKRILHRDIKPANIFMTSDGCVKLGDFGLGRFFSQNTRDAQTLVGTVYYMSPERITGSGYSFSSDVWSLGCVLYEMITLNSPFSLYHAHRRGKLDNKDVNNNFINNDNTNGKVNSTNCSGCQATATATTTTNTPNQQQQQPQQNQQLNLQWLIDRILQADYPPLNNFENITPRLRRLADECLNADSNARPNMDYICAIVNKIYDYQQQISAANRSQVQYVAGGSGAGGGSGGGGGANGGGGGGGGGGGTQTTNGVVNLPPSTVTCLQPVKRIME